MKVKELREKLKGYKPDDDVDLEELRDEALEFYNEIERYSTLAIADRLEEIVKEIRSGETNGEDWSIS